MFGRRKAPEAVAALEGHRIDFAPLQEGGWVVAFPDRVVLVGESVWVDQDAREPISHPWSDFEGANWNEGTRKIEFAFVNGSQPLVVTLAEGDKQKIAFVIRERVDRSIVHQEHATLPSGARARGLVRRTGDESLFTQVIIDGMTGPGDEERVEELEASLRDVTGISE